MNRGSGHSEEEGEASAPDEDPEHPLAGAGRPVTEAEARENEDRDPPA